MSKPFEIAHGTYTGTGAAQTITLGFKPAVILAYNLTDGDLIWGYINGMTDATAFTVVAATATVNANGCTLSSTGFALGSDNTINENAKSYRYVAIGGSDS